MTTSCIKADFEKQIVLRASRLIHVRKVKCLRSIFWVWCWPTVCRPTPAEAMRNLGYVQRFGIGIPTAQKALLNNGNPLADFTVDDSYVLVMPITLFLDVFCRY
jgi:hypothetical protein